MCDEFPYVDFICDCCGRKKRVVGSMLSNMAYFYLCAYNSGFYTFSGVTLCSKCAKIHKKLMEDNNNA